MESLVLMRMFMMRTFMVLLLPMFQDGNAQFFGNAAPQIIDDYVNNSVNHDQEQEHDGTDVSSQNVQSNVANYDTGDWFEIEVEPDVKTCLDLNRREPGVTSSQNQHLTILDIKQFGKALVIDGHLQSSEKDEFIYHENLVHPALLIHDEPKMVFIMGGGAGSSAREVLKHKNIEKVIMCDIDWEVVNFCREHTTTMDKNFHDRRFRIAYNDAKDELERSREKFDVIIGDLTHPAESGPCKHLYTKSFYEQVAKPKLNHKGIFVTQADQAGIFSHKNAFLPIYNTLKLVFTYVIAYTAQLPSFGDSYGWVMASDEPLGFDAEQLNNRINERIKGKLFYLDGHVIVASTILNKTLKTSLMN